MPAKKILIVIAPFHGEGGGSRRLRLWTRYFRQHYEVRLLSNEFDAPAFRAGPDLPLHHSKALNTLPRRIVLPAVAGIGWTILSYKPRYVISNYPWANFLTALALEVVRRSSGLEVTHLAHVAGRPQWGNAGAATQMLSHWMMKYAYNACDRVISVSDFDRRHIVQTYAVDDAKTQTVPIGIVWPAQQPAARDGETFNFGMVARLSYEKQVGKCIEAAQALRAEDSPPFRLHIFGDGPEREVLEAQARALGLQEVVTFHGFVKDPFGAMALLDCLLLYSDTEGTPRSILEAGAFEVPTIARDVGGVSEVVRHQHTGYLVHSEAELHERMRQLLRDPARARELGRQAKEFVCSRHTMEREIELIESLLC